MSIVKRLQRLGFRVAARASAESRTPLTKSAVIPLLPHEKLSVDVNAALNKAVDFELQCDWDRQIEANYMYVTPRSQRVLSICKATGFGLFESQAERDKHDDLYAHGLTLQLDIGYDDDGDWEDANNNVISYEDAKSYTDIPVAFHLNGARIAVGKLDKVDDVPEWITSHINQIDAALFHRLREIAPHSGDRR